MGERGAMLKATRIYLEQQNERPESKDVPVKTLKNCENR